MERQSLSTEKTNLLRKQGLLGQDEVVFVQGDLIIAENVLSGDKRIINNAGFLNESPKRVLLG